MQAELPAQEVAGRERGTCAWLVLVCVLSSLGGCALADLRTPLLRQQGLSEEGAQHGRSLLARAVLAQGGQPRWASHGTAELVLTDEWQGFWSWFLRPWPDNPQRMQVRYLLGSFSSRCTFLDGAAKGKLWGLQSWSFFEREPGGPTVFGENDDARFILPAYQFFFELPYRLAAAPIVAYAGEGHLGSETYDLVLATWGRMEPHAEDDQYLIWINRRTSRIEMVQYTIRELFGFVHGTNRFSDFRDVDGLVIPFRYTITSDPDDDDFLHRVSIESVRFDPVPREEFLRDIWPDIFSAGK